MPVQTPSPFAAWQSKRRLPRLSPCSRQSSKFLCPGREEEFRRENETYALNERSDPPPPPHFIQSFLRLPYAHFMQLMPDSLDSRLRANRRQDPKTLDCFEVLRLEPTAKIEQWTAELSSALAWLESIELVQGDLRPSNLLLDSKDHLKLVDFDSCTKIGDLDPGLPPPWSSPNHHLYGAKTEQIQGSFARQLITSTSATRAP